MTMWNRKQLAEPALWIVALFWGLTFPAIRLGLEDMDPFWFVFIRFSIAAVIMAAMLRPPLHRQTCIAGFGLGVLIWVAFLSQTLGLQTVGAGRAAFVTGLNVVLIPLFAPLFRAGEPRLLDYLGAAMAALGLYFLTEPDTTGIGVGDIWMLGCATVTAIHVLVLQRVLYRLKPNRQQLTTFQIIGVTFASLCVLPFSSGGPTEVSAIGLSALLFCSLGATVGALWLMAAFQDEMTPHRAALIYAMEPVFAAIFGYMILSEKLSVSGYIGAGLILIAINLDAGLKLWMQKTKQMGP